MLFGRLDLDNSPFGMLSTMTVSFRISGMLEVVFVKDWVDVSTITSTAIPEFCARRDVLFATSENSMIDTSVVSSRSLLSPEIDGISVKFSAKVSVVVRISSTNVPSFASSSSLAISIEVLSLFLCASPAVPLAGS